ncbi:MAG: AAA family ATPase [Holosporales bacterium]|jgi:DNA repair exonuclease SbcCD ATPase subunit|nr:AAA family ATPase [Holosporales bacterium]
MNTEKRVQFHFPQLEEVKLQAFSLYQLQPNVEIYFESGATCIVGANGIGKSTFLSSINYAMTGSVPEPKRKFLSVQEYSKSATSFTEDFFDGRINELDRESSSISMKFIINNKKYSITRRFFTNSELKEFSIEKNSEIILDTANLSSRNRNDKYKECICEDIGLHSFEQFIFLQHFLFTFDESRHLLFWDENASPTMLHICFGVSPQDAERADELFREMEQAGSLARNHQFAATNLAKQIESLQQSIIPTGFDLYELEKQKAEFDRLNEELSKAISNIEDTESRINHLDTKIAQSTSAMIAYKAEYNEIFNEYIGSQTPIERHPIIYNLVIDKCCPICKSQQVGIVEHVNKAISADTCPLCASSVTKKNSIDDSIQKKLLKIDKLLNEARISIDEASQEKFRRQNELKQRIDNSELYKKSIKDFEGKNELYIEAIKNISNESNESIRQQIDSLSSARANFMKLREKEYSRRDKLKEELLSLQKQLERKYAEAEVDFVPLFQNLAEKFLGIKLDVSLIAKNPKKINLELTMRGDPRNKSHQLSESQRFFVDIALRMALAQHISSSDSPATLLVDTPEGSLDIAYENRAGEMFAQFVASGHDLLMTTNINTSQLLLALASKCGSSSMKMIKMTEWTMLSDVQTESTDLFDNAFAQIQHALNDSLEA